MFKALYTFKKTHSTSISFEENDLFLELPGASGDKNWNYVINTHGQTGYVPKNYVEKKETTKEDFKKVAEEVKERVKTLSTMGNREKGEMLAKIDRTRIKFEQTLPTSAAYFADINNIQHQPLPPKPQNAAVGPHGPTSDCSSSPRSSTPPKSVKKRAAPKPPGVNSVKSSSSSREASPSSTKSAMEDVDAIQTVAEHNMKQMQKQ